MKPFTTLAVMLLTLIALLQLTRVVLGWEVTINGALVPIWASAVASIVASGLAYLLWREARG